MSNAGFPASFPHQPEMIITSFDEALTMSERKVTGGTKEFHYTNKDAERIRKTDTSSTKAFKESYKMWQEEQHARKLEEEMRRERRRLTLILAAVLLFLVLFVIYSFFK